MEGKAEFPAGTVADAGEPVGPELLRPAEAARMIGVGQRTLWRWSRSGVAPPPVKIGGAVRYRRTEYLAWIQAGCPRSGERAGARKNDT